MAKTIQGLRKHGRNDTRAYGKVVKLFEAKRLRANGKVGVTTPGQAGNWAK